jgi:hypothetical protein
MIASQPRVVLRTNPGLSKNVPSGHGLAGWCSWLGTHVVPIQVSWLPMGTILCRSKSSGADTEVRAPTNLAVFRVRALWFGRFSPSPALRTPSPPQGGRGTLRSPARLGTRPQRPTVLPTRLRRACSTARLFPAPLSRPPAAVSAPLRAHPKRSAPLGRKNRKVARTDFLPIRHQPEPHRFAKPYDPFLRIAWSKALS